MYIYIYTYIYIHTARIYHRFQKVSIGFIWIDVALNATYLKQNRLWNLLSPEYDDSLGDLDLQPFGRSWASAYMSSCFMDARASS